MEEHVSKEKVTIQKKKNSEYNTKEKFQYTVEQLQHIKSKQEVLDMYVNSVDDNFNLIGIVGSNIKATIPKEEFTSSLENENIEKYITSRVHRRMQVCIKDIILKSDNNVELILSRKMLELKVRKWMYMHLKPGMKLRGTIRNMTKYIAFVDVGGGVTGILKIENVDGLIVKSLRDVFRISQNINVVVEQYDKDTGKIELKYDGFIKSFEQNIKNMSEGDIVEGVVKDKNKAGIFIELKPNLVGLADHVNGIEPGQKVLVSIKKIIPEKKRIKLIIIG